MGTRHLIVIYYKKRYRVAQYGHYSGYLSYTGVGILQFLSQEENTNKLKDALDSPVDPGMLDDGSLGHNFLTRLLEEAAKIRQDPASAGQRLPLSERLADRATFDFVFDTIWCEYAYVIDLDNAVFESYGSRGRIDSLRFQFGVADAHRMISTYQLSRLPSEGRYLRVADEEWKSDESDARATCAAGRDIRSNLRSLEDLPVEILHSIAHWLSTADILRLVHTSGRLRNVFLEEHFVFSLLYGTSTGSALALKANEQLKTLHAMTPEMMVLCQNRVELFDAAGHYPENEWVSRYSRFKLFFKRIVSQDGKATEGLVMKIIDRLANVKSKPAEQVKGMNAKPAGIISLKLDPLLRKGASGRNTDVMFNEKRMILIIEYCNFFDGEDWTATDIEIWDLNSSITEAAMSIHRDSACHAWPDFETEMIAIQDFWAREIHVYSLLDLGTSTDEWQSRFVIDKVSKGFLLSNWSSFFVLRHKDIPDQSSRRREQIWKIEHWQWSSIRSDPNPKPVQTFEVDGHWQLIRAGTMPWRTSRSQTNYIVVDRSSSFAAVLLDGMLYCATLNGTDHHVLREYRQEFANGSRIGVEFGKDEDFGKVFVRRVLEGHEPTYQLVDVIHL